MFIPVASLDSSVHTMAMTRLGTPRFQGTGADDIEMASQNNQTRTVSPAI